MAHPRELLSTIRLKNNDIPIIHLPNSVLHTTAVVVTAGTLDDPPELEGMAHGVEHVVCSRSSTYTSEEAVLLMERLFGGTDGDGIAIYTIWSYTSYGHADLANRKNMREAFLLMATLVRDAIIECQSDGEDQRTFELGNLLTERAAIHNEVKKRRDDLELFVSETLQEYAYTTNPARFIGTGNIGQFRQLQDPGVLKRWAQQHYVTGNLLVLGIGPSENEMLRLVGEAGLDDLEAQTAPTPLYDGSDNVPVLSGVVHVDLVRPRIEQTHVGLAWPTEVFGTLDGPALTVLSRILKMRTEMLLRDENQIFDGGVYHPFSHWWYSKYHGLLELSFATAGEGVYVEWCIAQVLRICRDLKSDHSSALDRQVEAVRINLLDNINQEWQWFADVLCARLSEYYANGDTELTYLRWFEDEMAKITAADICRVAAKYLHTDRFVQVIVRPVP